MFTVDAVAAITKLARDAESETIAFAPGVVVA